MVPGPVKVAFLETFSDVRNSWKPKYLYCINMNKIYIPLTENIPPVSKFKKYLPELELVKGFIIDFY